jgi:F-type H+-transporting ATPase subunit gamma
MAGLREIRRHIGAVNSLWQMTNAMKKVAAARGRRYRNHLKRIEPYASGLHRVMSLLALRHGLHHPLLQPRPVLKERVLVIGSERGLCGAYNQEIIRGLFALPSSGDVAREFVVCGKRLQELFRSRGVSIERAISRPRHGDVDEVRPLSAELAEGFLADRFQRAIIVRAAVGSRGKRTVEHEILLPTAAVTVPTLSRLSPEIEPGSLELLDHLLPRYILSVLRTAFLESMALEEEARAMAMQAATNNAEEIETGLKKRYRRARQERITRELLELVAAPARGGLA